MDSISVLYFCSFYLWLYLQAYTFYVYFSRCSYKGRLYKTPTSHENNINYGLHDRSSHALRGICHPRNQTRRMGFGQFRTCLHKGPDELVRTAHQPTLGSSPCVGLFYAQICQNGLNIVSFE